jgi:cytochrome c biogenesis protein CcmG, thiol:disulfide interchange protein DsbE
VWLFVNSGDGPPRAVVGSAAPPIVGTTLDGAPFDLATYRGRPVLVNFWGPSCIPCREEFPLFVHQLQEHAADGLAIVGVLTDDPPEPARQFVVEYGANWPTVIDPDESLKRTYRVVGRPYTWFVDRTGIIRSQQLGAMTDVEFERHFAKIR